MTQPTLIKDELAAMRKVASALEPLDEAARERVVSWAFDRYRSSSDVPLASQSLGAGL